MNADKAQILVGFIQGEGYDAMIYEGYSGRGMYGQETTGIDTDMRPQDVKEKLEKRIEELGDQNNEDDNAELEDLESIGDFRSDSLGLGYILY